MKTLFKLLLVVVLLNNCSTYNSREDFQYPLETTKKINYFRVISFSKVITAKDFDGVIYLYNTHIVIKGESFLMKDYRFDFIEEHKRKKLKGKAIRSWKAYPYKDEQTKVYIEYKEDDYLYIIFPKKTRRSRGWILLYGLF